MFHYKAGNQTCLQQIKMWSMMLLAFKHTTPSHTGTDHAMRILCIPVSLWLLRISKTCRNTLPGHKWVTWNHFLFVTSCTCHDLSHMLCSTDAISCMADCSKTGPLLASDLNCRAACQHCSVCVCVCVGAKLQGLFMCWLGHECGPCVGGKEVLVGQTLIPALATRQSGDFSGHLHPTKETFTSNVIMPCLDTTPKMFDRLFLTM